MGIYNTALEVKISRVSLMANNMCSTMATCKKDNKKADGGGSAVPDTDEDGLHGMKATRLD
jgi:hypothetical protein